MSETKQTRIRYRVEHTTNRNGEWFPKFFSSLEEAMTYTHRLLNQFKKITYMKYRFHKETVVEELIESGEFYDSN